MTTAEELTKDIVGDFVAIHARGAKPCLGVAFFYEGVVGPGRTIMAGNATYPNGDKPSAGTRMTCGTCKNYIRVAELQIFLSMLAAQKLINK